MYQYFTNEPLSVGSVYIFTKEQYHHAFDVLHLHDEKIRLVYCQKAYYAICDRQYHGALVIEEDPVIREFPLNITLCMALIRREKFELVLQKAAELGVKRIVPFYSSRCVVQVRKEKQEHQRKRWQYILQSASEQCKRDLIPELCESVSVSSLKDYSSDVNLCAYEKAGIQSPLISDAMDHVSSVTIVIGPEGGFSEEEVQSLYDDHFMPVTLGKRILRAETAAIYACSVLAEIGEKMA
ncbi:MAG: RsmE family RNA methyltransferase [Erysipelotrichaceae bacterium]|nr:RsmE family RNA methyltransferase [Erysipelotrichaceae bacterium]